MKKLILSTVTVVTMGAGVSTSTYAALASDAVLNFNTGVSGGYYGGIVSGSYFGLDSNGNGTIDVAERLAISQHNGLVLGTVQVASGSHSGLPDGSELPSVDVPWAFGGNTGMHGTSSATSVTSTGANTANIDFSGWFVTWNGIPDIGLGGGLQDCGTDSDGVCVSPVSSLDVEGIFNNGTGFATVICAVDCAIGDAYTLDYSATVAQADPTNFGGVFYALHMEGTVSAVPIPSAIWLFGTGLLGLIGAARCRS